MESVSEDSEDDDDDCSLEDSYDSDVARQHGEAVRVGVLAKTHFDIETLVHKGQVRFKPKTKKHSDITCSKVNITKLSVYSLSAKNINNSCEDRNEADSFRQMTQVNQINQIPSAENLLEILPDLKISESDALSVSIQDSSPPTSPPKDTRQWSKLAPPLVAVQKQMHQESADS